MSYYVYIIRLVKVWSEDSSVLRWMVKDSSIILWVTQLRRRLSVPSLPFLQVKEKPHRKLITLKEHFLRSNPCLFSLLFQQTRRRAKLEKCLIKWGLFDYRCLSSTRHPSPSTVGNYSQLPKGCYWSRWWRTSPTQSSFLLSPFSFSLSFLAHVIHKLQHSLCSTLLHYHKIHQIQLQLLPFFFHFLYSFHLFSPFISSKSLNSSPYSSISHHANLNLDFHHLKTLRTFGVFQLHSYRKQPLLTPPFPISTWLHLPFSLFYLFKNPSLLKNL